MRQYLSTLTAHFALSEFLLHLLMAPILFGGVLYLVQVNYQNHFINQVRNDAFILASLSQSQDQETLHFQESILQDAVIGGRLLYAEIVDEQGNIINVWGDRRASSSMDEDFFFGAHDDTVYNITIPRYDNAGDSMGELHLGYDETPTHELIAQAYQSGLYLAIAYILVALILTLLVSKKVTRPIQQLHKASRYISQGHYEQALNVKTNVFDIQQLAETLEFMRHKLVEQNKRMEHLATHDSLTGLPNRLLLRDRVNEVFSDNMDQKQNIALLLVDLDRFKEINDTLGHLTGDEILKQTATRMLDCIRQSDTVARLGGDEFAIILPATGSESAKQTAQLVSDRLQQHFMVNDNKLQIGASIGIALYPEHGDNFETVLHCADTAMYISKRAQGSGAVMYDPAVDVDGSD
ncbi:MAG: diguanylate cyclase [Gammaproteobacteria bacterium]|nr:diguanylate cyclase [Gammaproteobacteria bacterium]